MKKKIIFRADGNSKTGLGHLYRLFALVEMYKSDYDFIFGTRKDSVLDVIPKEYPVKTIPNTITIEKEPSWLAANFSSKEYIIIADGYQFVSSYQKVIKEKGFDLMYIDDLTTEYMYADIVVNHSPNVKESDFESEPYTQFALGTNYAMLRPGFLDAAKKERVIDKIDTVFVCFGGADSFNLTLKAVKGLLQIKDFKSIHVVLGGAYTDQEIFELEEKYSNKIKIYKSLSEENLIKVMQLCNFAIVPASTILYELLCAKMPILSGFYIDNQELIYKGFLNSDVIYKGGNMKNHQAFDFVNNIKVILKENKFNKYIEAQKTLFDDKIATRHLKLIKTLC